MAPPRRALLPCALALALALAAAPGLDLAAAAPATEQPANKLRPAALTRLRTGATLPAGWLKDELTLQARGLSGQLPWFWGYINGSAWTGGHGSHPAQFMGYYLQVRVEHHTTRPPPPSYRPPGTRRPPHRRQPAAPELLSPAPCRPCCVSGAWRHWTNGVVFDGAAFLHPPSLPPALDPFLSPLVSLSTWAATGDDPPQLSGGGRQPRRDPGAVRPHAQPTPFPYIPQPRGVKGEAV